MLCEGSKARMNEIVKSDKVKADKSKTDPVKAEKVKADIEAVLGLDKPKTSLRRLRPGLLAALLLGADEGCRDVRRCSSRWRRWHGW